MIKTISISFSASSAYLYWESNRIIIINYAYRPTQTNYVYNYTMPAAADFDISIDQY